MIRRSNGKALLLAYGIWYFLSAWVRLGLPPATAAAAVVVAVEVAAEEDPRINEQNERPGTSDGSTGNDGGALATKYRISDPTLGQGKEDNKFRLDYEVSDYINTEKAQFRIHTKDCKGQLSTDDDALKAMLLSSSFQSNSIGDGTQSRILSLGFEFVSEAYEAIRNKKRQQQQGGENDSGKTMTGVLSSYWSKLSSYLVGESNEQGDDDGFDDGKWNVCVRFMVYNLPTSQDESIEVNFKETLVIMNIDDISESSEGSELKPKISTIQLEPVDPVSVEVRIAGRGKVVVEVPIDDGVLNNNEKKGNEDDPPKKELRQDLIQQKLKEMLEKDKLQKKQQQQDKHDDNIQEEL